MTPSRSLRIVVRPTRGEQLGASLDGEGTAELGDLVVEMTGGHDRTYWCLVNRGGE